jgi:hypothetical protein
VFVFETLSLPESCCHMKIIIHSRILFLHLLFLAHEYTCLLWNYAGKTTLRKAMVCSIEHRSTISKSILNPCKDIMMKKIDGGQRLIQGNKQLIHRTRGIEVHSLKSSEGIRWSIWDMGGQEEFHGFHYFMLPDLSDTGNPSLFLLVCSPYVLRDQGSP